MRPSRYDSPMAPAVTTNCAWRISPACWRPCAIPNSSAASTSTMEQSLGPEKSIWLPTRCIGKFERRRIPSERLHGRRIAPENKLSIHQVDFDTCISDLRLPEFYGHGTSRCALSDGVCAEYFVGMNREPVHGE